MNDEYLLVDGYNIIHAWDELKAIANYDLDSARQKLIDIMSDYQGYKQINIIVVFDAYNIKGNTRIINKNSNPNVNVVYTKEAETADRFIEKITHKMGRTNKIRVATSDKVEQIIILGNGATRVSAKELQEEVKHSKSKQRKKYIENRPPKNNLLEDNLPEDIKKWMEEFRRQ